MNNKHHFKLIGLTGSIGSGKSQVAKYLEDAGAYIIDADILAREVIKPNSPGIIEIKQKFGSGFIDNNGHLDRKKMAKLIFKDPIKKELLENIIHPKVRNLFLQTLQIIPKDIKIVVYVVPLLFETKNKISNLDYIINVSSKKELCLRRIIDRDKLTIQEATKRFDSQIPPEVKDQKSDFVIYNNGSLEELKTNTVQVLENIISISEKNVEI